MGARQMVGVMVVALGMAGCAGEGTPEPEPTLRSRVAELASPNGRNINGRNINGRNINGPELGQLLVSVSYANAWSGGVTGGPLDAVWLEGSVFHGRSGGSEVSGLDFVGTRFIGNLGDGSTVELRVDEIQPGTGTASDVWRYRVSYFNSEENLWKPACPAEDGSALNAIAVAGRWNYETGVPGGGAKLDDPRTFTFACEGAAIAKCIHFGYRPWATTAGGRSLADLHQACTRMVRADFCGNGTSYTQDGNWVNLYDAVGVQADTEQWLVEAEWDADGARCFTQTTRAAGTVRCAQKGSLPGCGLRGHFRAGTLLMSEVPWHRFTTSP